MWYGQATLEQRDGRQAEDPNRKIGVAMTAAEPALREEKSGGDQRAADRHEGKREGKSPPDRFYQDKPLFIKTSFASGLPNKLWVDQGRPGRWRLPPLPIAPDGASHDILAFAPRTVPVVEQNSKDTHCTAGLSDVQSRTKRLDVDFL